MVNAKIQAIFDEITDAFDPSDGISVANVNHEVHRYWQDFL